MQLRVLILLICISYSFQNKTPYIDFLEDFVKFEGMRSSITEFSCDINRSIQLLKRLSAAVHKFNCLQVDAVSRLEFPIHKNTQIFVLNIHCSNIANVLIYADSLQLFKFPFRWIILFNSSLTSLEDISKEYFSDVNISVDSDVNLAEFKENNEVYVRKVFKSGFEKSIAKRRKDLFGITLKASMVVTHNDSLNHLTDKRYKHIDSIAKVNYVLTKELGSIFNISLKFSVENTWGYMNNKSEWNGMIGRLIRKEADIGATALFVTRQRVDLIDYVSMTTPTRSKFVFRSPKLSYVSNVYTLPFDINVWISTIFLMIITAIILFIIIKWEWRKKLFATSHNTGNSSEINDSFLDVAVLTISAVCQQGASSLPFSIPGRMAAIFLYLSFMFLYTSYAANIVALLQSASNNIKTLQDLLSSRLQIGVDDTVYNRFYFPKYEDPVRRDIYLQKVAPPGKKDNFMPLDEGVAKMRQGLFAFHMEIGSGYKIISETFREDEKCGLQEIAFLSVVDPWFAIQKNSTYKEMLKIGLRLIQESGLQSRENNLIYTKKPICSAKSSSFINVGLVDCYPAAALLVGGIILSLAIFFLEVFVNYRLEIYEKKSIAKQRVKQLPIKRVSNDEYLLEYSPKQSPYLWEN